MFGRMSIYDRICVLTHGGGFRMKVTTRPDDISERASRLHVVIAELLSAIIASTVSFDEMYQIVLDKARWLTESQHGFVSSIEKKTDAHVSNTLTQMRDEGCTINAAFYSLPEGPHKLYSSLWGHSLNIRESFFTNNPSSHAAAAGLPSGHVPLKNFLSVPIIFGDKILGQIALANSVREYTEDDLKEIKRLGEVYAIVLHNRQQESELRRSEEQFRSMVEMAPFPMLVTGRELSSTILYGNLRAAELFKVSQEALIGSTVADYNQKREEWIAILDEIEKNGCALDKEMQFYDVSGKACWVLLFAVKIIWFGSEALMITINDITDRKNMEETLRKLATVDYLTGIWNRRYIMDLGNKEFESCLRYKTHMSVIIFDLDHFKLVNDKYGHNIGDRVLEGTAKVVTNELRGRDIFGRYGGEEFVIVFPEISLGETAKVAERLRQAIEKCQYSLENSSTLTVTASFGISEVIDNDRAFEEILTRADYALYKAKALGRNRIYCS
jgi:diguanylate cyclase (GGDEF)-like protein/PAS domain S-box-containing protein